MNEILDNEIAKINDFTNIGEKFSESDNFYIIMYQDLINKLKFIILNIPELLKMSSNDINNILEYIRVFVFNYIARYKYNFNENFNICILVEILLKFKFDVPEFFYNNYYCHVNLMKLKRLKNIIKISHNSIKNKLFETTFYTHLNQY